MYLLRLLTVVVASLSVPACFVETRHPGTESRSCGGGQHWENGSCRGNGQDHDHDKDHGKDHDKDHDKDRDHDHH